MNDEQTPALREAVENMVNMREAYDNLSQAAEAYNVGKVQLAQAITSKGVETSPTETYPKMAEKVNTISQEMYEINGGELYAKQLFGSLETPNYWNLYDVLAHLLSDGRLVNYGGILLAEYYRGYDSLALNGAGSGGAYVVSDKDENGQFKMYTEDTTHTWATDFDGKGNRWVAYCFVDEYHDFQITDTNTSPRSIFIGRKVGTITSLVNGRVSQIVVPDGNKLSAFNTKKYTQYWAKNVVVKNLGDTFGTTLLYNSGCESIYIKADRILANKENEANVLIYEKNTDNLRSVIIECPYIKSGIHDGSIGDPISFISINRMTNNLSYLSFKNCEYLVYAFNPVGYEAKFQYLKQVDIIGTEYCSISGNTKNGSAIAVVNISYITNDKSKSVSLSGSMFANTTNVVLQDCWNKPLIVSTLTSLTEENMYAHILQRLKQDEPDCGDGVTITLGSTNLAKLTSKESQELLALLRGTYGYTFA